LSNHAVSRKIESGNPNGFQFCEVFTMKPRNKILQKLDHLDALPAIPSIAQKILSLKTYTDEGERALLELVNNDPPILARIIGLANSPLFGTGRKILTLNESVALLGTNRIKMIALNFAMQSSMTRNQTGVLNIQQLWQHSLAVAMTMDTLAHFMPEDKRPLDNEVYLIGLLHDIGYLVLKYLDARLSDKLHTRMAEHPEDSLREMEMEILDGIDHGELGSMLAQHWKLPESIIETLKYHNAPDDDTLAPDVKQTVAMIVLSEKLLPAFAIAEHSQSDIIQEEWLSLGIDPLRAEEIRDKVNKLDWNFNAG
jgi:HD-like signal output (HDOD) protein